MADLPFVNFAFAAAGAPTPRTMPVRLADVINVKDYGAIGDGSAPDRAAIQAAFDAAFTTSGTPHGTNTYLNKEVFFPAGHYIIDSPLTLTQVQGAKITGSGKQSTVIDNTAGSGDNGAVLVTNGLQDSYIAHLTLQTPTGAVTAAALELDWDGTSPYGISLSGNTFLSLNIGPGGGNAGRGGVRIGRGGYGGANNAFLCVKVGNYLTSGIAVEIASDASTNNQLYGGNLQNNAAGVVVTRGAVSLVDGTAFQQQAGYDIEIKSTAAGGVAIFGTSSESFHFFKATGDLNHALNGCSQRSDTQALVFAYLDGCVATLQGCCTERSSTISCRNGVRVSIADYATMTTTSAWLDAPASGLWRTPTNPYGAIIELENITYDKSHVAGGPFRSFKQRIDVDPSTGLIRTRNYQVA